MNRLTRIQWQGLVAVALTIALVIMAALIWNQFQPERPTRTWGAFNMGDK